ncbi:MAG: hydrogenase maturation nickel metallochaperone HypA [Gaiella sp.]
MHELAICTSITRIAQRHAAGRPVERVCVAVGDLRQVVPETLSLCWEVAVRETELDGAALEVTAVPVTIACRACGARTALDEPRFRCTSCDGSDVEVVAGDELLVTSLVLQEG